MSIQRLRKHLHIYDQRRRSFLSRISELPPDLLSIKPGPKRWSLIQVLDHLVAAERTILMGLPDYAQLTHRPVTLRNRVGYFLVIGLLKWRIPVPVPSRDMLPEAERDLDELRRRWDENIDWLRGAIDRLKTDSAVFMHPVTGPLNTDQVLRLARLHLGTHLRQDERIKKDIKDALPKAGRTPQHP
jgi:uncharacterized damage-inducible protein DinB